MNLRKVLVFIFLLTTLFGSLRASSIKGGEISINHIQNFDYEVKTTLYAHCCDAFQFMNNVQIDVYQRQGAQLVSTLNLPLTLAALLPYSNIECGLNPIHSETVQFTDTITLSPTIFNHPGGYLFQYQNCCRDTYFANAQISPGTGISLVTLFPPVVDTSGNQIINSSPQLDHPFPEFSVNQHPFISDYGGFDADGDSLDFTFYTPFEDAPLTLGSNSPISGIWPDPTSQYAPIIWATGYGQDNQMHGFPGPNPSPNRLQINSATGELTAVPDSPTPGFHVVGIWCREYRNGELIGSIFRETTIINRTKQISPNNPPQILPIELLQNAYWSGDTIVFDSSEVCLRIAVQDPDSVSRILLKIDQNDYDSSELSFIQNQAVITSTDTFRTRFCIEPDTILNKTSSAELIALSPGCYDPKSDTLKFYFKFDQVSGIDEKVFEKIKIYPNPAKDIINISSFAEEAVIEIFDIHGKTVEFTILYKGKNAISVKDLPNGIYILKSANSREKFIINR